MCGKCGFCGTRASEESEACFVLPRREAFAHFARGNARHAETEVCGSDAGNAHAGTDKSANFGAGFLPLLGKWDRQFLQQQDLRFFAEEIISGNHEQREVPALLEAGPKVFLLFLALMGC